MVPDGVMKPQQHGVMKYVVVTHLWPSAASQYQYHQEKVVPDA